MVACAREYSNYSRCVCLSIMCLDKEFFFSLRYKRKCKCRYRKDTSYGFPVKLLVAMSFADDIFANNRLFSNEKRLRNSLEISFK